MIPAFLAIWFILNSDVLAISQRVSDHDMAVVTAALRTVALQEFAKYPDRDGNPPKHRLHFDLQSKPAGETELKTLRLYSANRGWPVDAAKRVAQANKQSGAFESLTLEGIELVDSRSAVAEATATLPGYVDHEAFVFVRFRLKAWHTWLVRLAQDGGKWQIVAAVPIAFS
jgi:hypothetical protein